MSQLVEFLKHRLDNAQRDAETRNTAALIHETGCYYYNNQYDPAHCDCAGPEHALREVAAKRAIINEAEPDTDGGYIDGWWNEHDRVLRLLAAPYSDHPDYREEWAA